MFVIAIATNIINLIYAIYSICKYLVIINVVCINISVALYDTIFSYHIILYIYSSHMYYAVLCRLFPNSKCLFSIIYLYNMAHNFFAHSERNALPPRNKHMLQYLHSYFSKHFLRWIKAQALAAVYSYDPISSFMFFEAFPW